MRKTLKTKTIEELTNQGYHMMALLPTIYGKDRHKRSVIYRAIDDDKLARYLVVDMNKNFEQTDRLTVDYIQKEWVI